MRLSIQGGLQKGWNDEYAYFSLEYMNESCLIDSGRAQLSLVTSSIIFLL
jgi:hypothetical protein